MGTRCYAVMADIAFVYHFLCLKVENELVDLIDELLERDAGTVNSTIIGKLQSLDSGFI